FDKITYLFQAGASQATFLATVAARARSIKSLKGDKCDLPDSYYLPKLVAYYSENCHSSVEKAAKLCLLQLRKLPAEDNHRVRGSTLEKAIQKDVECGLVPCIVSAAIGSTSVASCDKLTEFGPICKRFPNLWLHVDGAYSGNFCILPELRYILDGIECADSIIVNCKKALLMLMDCEALFLKEKKHLSEALCAGPPYIPYGLQTDQDDPGIYDTGFSHRNRALKLWYLFRSYGVEGLQQHLRTTICLARCFKALLEMDERFEVTNDVLVSDNIVLQILKSWMLWKK
ncbi:Aromatic-L-amino-acid decarboxylase, partial [Blattella germanica]